MPPANDQQKFRGVGFARPTRKHGRSAKRRPAGPPATFQLRIEADLRTLLEASAKQEGVSLNTVIINVLCDYVANRLGIR